MQQLIEKTTILNHNKEFCYKRDSCPLLQDALIENEKLRDIFSFRTKEFEEKNKRIAILEEELNFANKRIKELEKKLQKKNAINKLLNKMLYV